MDLTNLVVELEHKDDEDFLETMETNDEQSKPTIFLEDERKVIEALLMFGSL